jgi:hypothetical protein
MPVTHCVAEHRHQRLGFCWQRAIGHHVASDPLGELVEIWVVRFEHREVECFLERLLFGRHRTAPKQ